MVKVETFNKNKELLYSKRKFHLKQIEFFNYVLDVMNSDRDTDTITVFPARCGLGKTTFLRIFIKSWLTDNKNRGLIIVTDNLRRLSELNDENDNRIAYLTAENKSTEIIRQSFESGGSASGRRAFLRVRREPRGRRPQAFLCIEGTLLPGAC